MTDYLIRYVGYQVWVEWEGLRARRYGSVSSVSWALKRPQTQLDFHRLAQWCRRACVDQVNPNDADPRLSDGWIPGGIVKHH